MKFPQGPGIYGILTDPLVGYARLAEIMVDCGVKVIQLRMKETPRETVVKTAREVRKVIPAHVLFIINDDPSIALEVGADGVHLGQDDMPYATARAMLGPDAVIGISTHNPRQTAEACAMKPDYIGVGPVYPTPTKLKADPVIGLDGMRAMLALATVPAVCIGGIDQGNARDVVAAGAKNICAVRCITRSDRPASAIAGLMAVFGGAACNTNSSTRSR